MKHQLSMAIPVPTTTSGADLAMPSASAPATTSIFQHPHKAAFAVRSVTLGPQSSALRPDDLHVRPWYALNESVAAGSSSILKDSPDYSFGGHPYDVDVVTTASSTRALDAVSTRTSSMESEHHPQRTTGAVLPRKACMDLNEAIALLDEMCPNPETSPTTTPRTPLTPHSRNKRARSKSSDNSSNYSTERLNDKENHKEKKRPFLKKIGLSMTEDRPFLAKLAPRILGKPYLEKIGHSRAVDKPFLEKIGSSRTLDKFVFDTPKSDQKRNLNASKTAIAEEEPEVKSAKDRRDEIRGFTTGERRKSGKSFLSKMYSFETEDLEDTSLTVKAKHKGPLRGASLDDVLDSGPSSMPRINEMSAVTSSSEIERIPSPGVAELVKCRVTTSEEIISSGTSLNSPMDVISWGNSPRKREGLPPSGTFKNGGGLVKFNKSNESVPNSPTKCTQSITPEKVTAVYREINKMKTSRQASEDILDKRKSRFDKFEPRGASSDNLTKDRVVTPVFAEIGLTNINGKGSNTSVVSTSSSLKQFYEKYEGQEVFTETYAEFKRRTQGNFSSSNALKRLVAREKMSSPSFDLGFSSKDAALEKMKSEGSPKVRSKSVENNRQNNGTSNDTTEFQSRRTRNRSTLRKQQGIDHSNYPNELEHESTCQRKKMVHEPSQETLDLLSELQKVKSSLKTPSVDKTYETDIAELKPFPRRILLTDQEFCLSIERENSVRRPSRKNTLETKNWDSVVSNKSPEKKSEGPALFEKRCLSLDFVDDDKSITKKTEEPRALSLLARSPRSEGAVESSEMILLSCDSKSYSSDVFNSPTEEGPEKSISRISVGKEVKKIETEIQILKQEKSDQSLKKMETSKTEKNDTKKLMERNGKKTEKVNNLRPNEKKETKGSNEDVKSGRASPKQKNFSELEVAGNREAQQTSPKRKCHSDSTYEVTSSPKATPFRIKKRLGRVSVEETVKQESFTVNKVECKDVTTTVQKRAKCLPL